MNPEIERLIEIAAKGETVTNRQKELILKKAVACNEDPDEVEYLLDLKHSEYHRPKKKSKKKAEPARVPKQFPDDGIDEIKKNDNSTPVNVNITEGNVPVAINTVNYTEPLNPSKGKSKDVAALLALFLGCLGVHKFYMGNTKVGVMYILFLWTTVPFFLALIDAIVLFFESETTFNSQIR